MCTSVSFNGNHHYFGRNLDLDYTFNQEVVITPRNVVFELRNGQTLSSHFAMIGMAVISNNYPLYFDATNEKGLSIAGLNYPKNAFYQPDEKTEKSIASFELIPYVLSQCTTIDEVKSLLDDLIITDVAFSPEFPSSPLHWIIADKHAAITVESDRDGLHVYDNPVGVLTNNPPFPTQLFNLNNYRHLSAKTSANFFAPQLDLDAYSNGMGAIGLPGDLSSMSRFVRATFTKEHSLKFQTVEEDINQFFHILSSVWQTKGLCDVGEEHYEYTIYSSCCDTDTGIYYYKTYNNSQISAVSLHHEDLDASDLIHYPLATKTSIHSVN